MFYQRNAQHDERNDVPRDPGAAQPGSMEGLRVEASRGVGPTVPHKAYTRPPRPGPRLSVMHACYERYVPDEIYEQEAPRPAASQPGSATVAGHWHPCTVHMYCTWPCTAAAAAPSCSNGSCSSSSSLLHGHWHPAPGTGTATAPPPAPRPAGPCRSVTRTIGCCRQNLDYD
jgi:hypothetical protein